jgi:hypothetical protein
VIAFVPRSHRFVLIALLALLTFGSVQAHQLVLTTGYANSGTPKTGRDVAFGRLFRAGSGYTFSTRVDVDAPRAPIWFGPQFLFWNNVTAAPNPSARANYFQIEFGGRASIHTRSDPTLYSGIGIGYTFAHGSTRDRSDGSTQTFDGDFPSASIHFGAKTSTTSGITVLGEGSYHFGLENASGPLAVGPARAWLVQIGIGFDLMLGHPQ